MKYDAITNSEEIAKSRIGEKLYNKMVRNYTGNEVKFTRIIEYKHFLNQQSPHTIIVGETTNDEGEPYYPVLNDRNINLYKNIRIWRIKNNPKAKLILFED